MIEVLKEGFYTSIQDRGRISNYECQLPQAGCMDMLSSNIANRTLQNSENAAVIEITMQGPELLFHCRTAICISGALMNPSLNGKAIKNNKAYKVSKGDLLSFGKITSGFRAYLAVKDGIQSELAFNSRSQFIPITKEARIYKGQQIKIAEKEFSALSIRTSNLEIENNLSETILEAFPGPEFDKLSDTQIKNIKDKIFSISNLNNRMAYQLNEGVKNNIPSIITSLVQAGTVQLTPSGTLIILMRDSQSTGGYPRILQLSERAINVLSQKTTRAKFRFRIVG